MMDTLVGTAGMRVNRHRVTNIITARMGQEDTMASAKA